MSLNAPDKVAQQKLSLLELAETLNNISEACRRKDLSRTMYYEYKRRFQTHRIEGLRDLPPIHHFHPQTTPPPVVERILLSTPVVKSSKSTIENVPPAQIFIQGILSSKGGCRSCYARRTPCRLKSCTNKE